MVGNIGCYAACDNPVIGQCGGYPNKCGRYYCREHSRDRLCGECFNLLSAEVQRQRLVSEKEQQVRVYLETIRKLPTRPGSFGTC